jgi:hypothetical protein
MKRCFGKELAGNKFLVEGKAVPFEILEGNRGVIALDDTDPEQKKLIDALDKVVGTRGIYKITESELAEKKRTLKLAPFGSRLPNGEIRAMPSRRLSPIDHIKAAQPADNGNGTGDADPAPVSEQTPVNPVPPATGDFQPARRRIRRNPAAAVLEPGGGLPPA